MTVAGMCLQQVHIFVPSRRTSGGRGKPPTYPQTGKLAPEQPAGESNAVLMSPPPTASTIISAELSEGSPVDSDEARRSGECGQQSPAAPDACRLKSCQLVTQVNFADLHQGAPSPLTGLDLCCSRMQGRVSTIVLSLQLCVTRAC
jgi:hypothetical protein